MQRKCHRCDRLFTPIDHARLEKAFEQTGRCNPHKVMCGDWECEEKQRLEHKRRYKKGK